MKITSSRILRIRLNIMNLRIRDATSLYHSVSTQVLVLRIPPPAGGGLFNPSHCFSLSIAWVRIEQSTTCRWWDSGNLFSPCRLGLNDLPAPAGRIWLNIICVDTNETSSWRLE